MKKHLLIAISLIPFFFLVACTDSVKPKETEKLTELKTHTEKFGYALGTYYGKTSTKMDIKAFVQGFEDAMTGAKPLQTLEESRNTQSEGINAMPKETDESDYTIGSDLGKLFLQNDSKMDIKAFVQGFEDFVTGAKLLKTPEELKDILREESDAMQQRMTEKNKILAEKNKKEGEAFLAENTKKEGIITTESGLQYEVLTEGTGPIPQKTDIVKVNYSGKLLDGTEFESSFKRGRPSTLGVSGVIPGLTEALQMMKTGSKWRIYIPGDLAYKERGGPNVGPSATLIFDIELLSIEKTFSKSKTKEAVAN